MRFSGHGISGQRSHSKYCGMYRRGKLPDLARSSRITFGSHSVTHADFRSLGPEQIDYELGYSKETIEQEIGAQVDSFSYPFALPDEDRDFTRYLADTLENLGYANGVSSAIGRAKPRDTRLFLPRLPVNSCDDVELFRAKLEGGYDWLHW